METSMKKTKWQAQKIMDRCSKKESESVGYRQLEGNVIRYVIR